MTQPVVLFEKKGHIAVITLNRPEVMNAMNYAVWLGIKEAWERVNEDDEIWVGILTGAGQRAFSAGADLKELSQGSLGSRSPAELPMLFPMEIKKPTIAAVNGYALAGGFVLAAFCDLRIAADHAEFGMPNARVGRSAAYAFFFTRLLPSNLALDLVMTGNRIGARRAYEIGFINRVVPGEQLMEAAFAMAEAICAGAPLCVRALRNLVYNGWSMSKTEGLAYADALESRIAVSEDRKEGRRAFAAKRAPQWKGR